jgi:hypothetical protein
MPACSATPTAKAHDAGQAPFHKAHAGFVFRKGERDMPQTAPNATFARSGPRHRRIASQPLPHPSWTHGRDFAREGRIISADDFWTRLGI